MIKVNNLNKYFNKNKKNEIHVLNNVTLQFPEKGLVALIGASGSGKTTLLNVIGGLDSVARGDIELDGKNLSKYRSAEWDKIRSKDVGYIFQNYNLLKDMTVYQNLEFALNTIGIQDKEEIDRRVAYVLKAVNIFKYRKRLATELSGGQQQRVAIARALVKNPKIIIADEPTGNLDSKNTLEVMNIIKQISLDKLVVLVTHERNIADFYADRVIEIKDGKIEKDVKNTQSDHHGLDGGDVIYLKDLQKLSQSKSDNVKIALYAEDKSEIENLDVKLIVKNNTIYLDLNSNLQKVKIVGQDSSVEIKDTKKSDKSRSEIIETAFDLSNLNNEGLQLKTKATIPFKKSIRYAYERVKSAGRVGKLMLFGMLVSGGLIALAASMLFGALNVSYKSFIYDPSKVVSVTLLDYGGYANDLSYFNQFKAQNDADFFVVAHGDGVSRRLILNSPNASPLKTYRTLFNDSSTTNTLTLNNVTSHTVSALNSSDLVAGRMPQNNFEFLIDKSVLEIYLEKNTLQEQGLWDVSDYSKLKMSYQISKNDVESEDDIVTFKAVGLTDTGSSSAFFTTEGYYLYQMGSSSINSVIFYEEENMTMSTLIDLYNTLPLSLFENELSSKFNLVAGQLPQHSNEMLMSKDTLKHALNLTEEYVANTLSFPMDVSFRIPKAGLEYETINVKVTGVFESDDTNFLTVATNSFIAEMRLLGNFSQNASFSITSSNPEYVYNAIKNLGNEKVLAVWSYEEAKNMADEIVMSNLLRYLIPVNVMIGATAVGFYFLMRSSMMSRIYQLSVYRALGVRKRDIYLNYVIETLFITTISSLLGFIGTSYFLNVLSNSVSGIGFSLAQMFSVGFMSVTTGILAMYAINVLVGLLPVFMLLFKTPSQILSKYDI